MTPPGTEAPALNAAQRAAADHDAGPLIVLAGPGTGKTRVITHRVERLIRDGAPPESILAVTYTVKAARQLRERLAALVGPGAADRVQAHTFHGFGYRLILRFPDYLGLPGTLKLIDSAQSRRLLRSLIREHDLFTELLPAGRDTVIDEVEQTLCCLADHAVFPEQALAEAERWLERLREPSPAGGARGDPDEAAAERQKQARFSEIAGLYGLYRDQCTRRGWLTFNELILRPIELLGRRPAAAAIVRSEVRHVVVDEFQDVNAAQIELLRLLCPAREGRAAPDLCIVGDDDQSIYEFRGADDRAFARFARLWPRHETIPLSENYRSQRPIIDAANAIMARAEHRFAPDKAVELPGCRRNQPAADGAAVECITTDDNGQAGQVIAAMILADRAGAAPHPWRSYAVIARGHADLDRIASALHIEGIPVRRSRGSSALDDRGVMDVLHWVEMLAEPGSTLGAAYAAQWLLGRPPYLVPAPRLYDWASDYRAQASRWRIAGQEPESFTEWLAARARGTPEEHTVRRFVELEQELRRMALLATAERALFEIIRRSDVAHAEILPSRERARRVGHLAEMLRFVRARMDILDPPADLRAFWSYYQDLSEQERAFRGGHEDRVDGDDTPEDEQPDAVTLLTAHSAKGLEFDTVFIPRVRPGRGGFPSSGDDGIELPEGLLDRGEDRRTIRERRACEERRLFYVAATRAMRRLVLLAEKRKARTKNTDFFNEIALDEPCAGFAITRTAAEVLDEAARRGMRMAARSGIEDAGAGLEPAYGTPEARRETLDRVRREARLAAAQALESVDRPGIPLEDLDRAAARAREAIDRVALAAQMASPDGAVIPGWVVQRGPELVRFGQELADRLRNEVEAEATGPAGLFRPLPAPLTLSYSWIDEYGRCPRCFYLRRVLKFPEPQEAPQVVGTAAHHALAEYFRRTRRAEAGEGPRPTLEVLLALAREEFLRVFPARSEADPEQLAQLAAQLRLAHERLIDPAHEVQEVEFMIRFPYRRGAQTHSFEAKIDRLDRLPPPAHGHRIVDYKTGAPRKTLLEPAADDLQFGVYAMAVSHHQRGGHDGEGGEGGEGVEGGEAGDEAALLRPAAGVAEYWVLASGQRGTLDLADMDYGKVKERIDTVIDGMLAGDFPAGKEGSGGCWGLCRAVAGGTDA
jgi:superfamily I DNA/RNA helicase/RecB family exonuclease